MTNAGKFDEWMADTNYLIDLIKAVGDRKWNLKKYDSPHFSYDYNGNFWVFKYNRVLTSDEELRSMTPQLGTTSIVGTSGMISVPIGPVGASGGYTTGYTTISNNTKTQPGINTVIITVGGDKIQSVQWVRKPNSGLTIINTLEPSFGNMEGGIVRASMLFLDDNKILVNDKIYSNDSPDAFNNDITGDEDFRYLDLLNFRERYDDKLY